MTRTILAALLAAVAAQSLARSQESPVTWEPQPSGVTVRLRGVNAVSSTVAWASGAGGTVLRTTDGGRTWQRRAVPGADALDFRDVDALGATTAVALSIGVVSH